MTVKVKNTDETNKDEILEQMREPRPLPMGRQEFEDWSDRIISGALVPADVASQKFALADLLMHLGPTESHKPDAFFIHSLRKFAVNQVAHAMREELKAAKNAEIAAKAAEEAAKNPKPVVVPSPSQAPAATVTSLDEARKLRKAGFSLKALIFGSPKPL